MSNLTFCRICLNTNVRMHQILDSEVHSIYEKITNIKVQEDESGYYACYLCYGQLKNCLQLARKSERSEKMLNQILAEGRKLNLKSISLIDRKAYDLLHSMMIVATEPIQILESDENIKLEKQTECGSNKMMVKYEPDDENISKHYEENDGGASDHSDDTGIKNGSLSGSDDNLPLMCINALTVNVKKITAKKQIEKEKNRIKKEINKKRKTQDNVKSKHIQNRIDSIERDATSKRNCLKPDINRKRDKREDLSKIAKGISLTTKQTKQQDEQTDGYKHQRENTLKLLLNSNSCVFTSYRTKFGCELCPERFLDINRLREHTKIHSNDKYIASSVNYLRGRTCKNVDISNLSCRICEQQCQDLTELQTHLTGAHSMQFVGTDNFLTPYKLENGLQCILCHENFNTFLRLSIHMNSHSTNNVCEICGMSYINRSSLRLHVQAVHREKKCSLCSSTFRNNSTKMRHMRSVHRSGDYKRYCQLCEKTFRYTYMLVEHRIKEHGAKRTISECLDCGKQFSSMCNLKIHIRSVHIRERNFPCSVCDMRFFTKCDQKRHERTHEDVRSFSCAHCEGRFKTKDSWRRHLKRQHPQLLPQT